jgi:ribonuclease BN (tRNA processing enzyme)
MNVVLLGTGGYYPTERRQTACIMLPEVGVVLDAGSGMCRLGECLQTSHLEIFLTHAHLDHVLGLTYLLAVVPREVLRQTTIHGEAEKLAAVRDHLFDNAIFPIEPQFRCEPLNDAPPLALASGGTLTHFPLAHPGGCVGFRLDWPGHSLAYVTDTTAASDAAYIEYVRDVDLLLHECYFAENESDLPRITGHSWLMPVAEVAAAAKARRLVLVHIGPHYERDDAFDLQQAKRIFPNIELGVDRMTLEF